MAKEGSGQELLLGAFKGSLPSLFQENPDAVSIPGKRKEAPGLPDQTSKIPAGLSD